MKKLILVLTLASLSLSSTVNAQSWLDSLKSLVGLGESTEQEAPSEQKAPSISAMVSEVTQSLGVKKNQAEGGLGAIFNYAKNNISADQFTQLSTSLPGVAGLIDKMPAVSNAVSSTGISDLAGLMDKAAEYSDSIKALNDVKKQFDALGLKPEMIAEFAATAKQYLDTEQGQQAKDILGQGLAHLLN
jgi:hypothetical protein